LLLIGYLAVYRTCQGKGLGSALLAEALRKCRSAASIVKARGVVVHAIDDYAASFYKAHGFTRSPLGELVLFSGSCQANQPLFRSSLYRRKFSPADLANLLLNDNHLAASCHPKSFTDLGQPIHI
jgi:GNAT superfamily N-acetyltransferase